MNYENKYLKYKEKYKIISVGGGPPIVSVDLKRNNITLDNLYAHLLHFERTLINYVEEHYKDGETISEEDKETL